MNVKFMALLDQMATHLCRQLNYTKGYFFGMKIEKAGRGYINHLGRVHDLLHTLPNVEEIYYIGNPPAM